MARRDDVAPQHHRVDHLALLLVVAAGCQPNFGSPLSLVTEPRVVAVRAEPAEATPGQRVMLTPLVVSPSGTVAMPSLDWSVCLQPKPATENDVVAAACSQAGGTTPVATGAAAPTISLPSNGCRLFGPDLPPQVAGQPPPRSRPADATGGYYQPLRVDLGGASSFALERIRCGAAGASMELAQQFQAQYTPNQNPTLAPLAAAVDGVPATLDGIARGARVSFSVGWTAESPERYPVVDALDQILVTRREAMSVAWFASDGAFVDEETGRGEDDATLDTTNVWTAPSAAATVYLWIVLRDSRGGQDFAGYTVSVR